MCETAVSLTALRKPQEGDTHWGAQVRWPMGTWLTGRPIRYNAGISQSPSLNKSAKTPQGRQVQRQSGRRPPDRATYEALGRVVHDPQLEALLILEGLGQGAAQGIGGQDFLAAVLELRKDALRGEQSGGLVALRHAWVWGHICIHMCLSHPGPAWPIWEESAIAVVKIYMFVFNRRC